MKTERQLEIYRYFLSIKKQWPLCLTIFLSVLLLGLIITVRTPKLYKASAVLKVNLDPSNTQLWASATDYQIMSTPDMLDRVLNKKNLANKDNFLINPSRDFKSVSFEVLHSNSKEAADLANAAMSVYLKYQTEKREEAFKKEEKFLRVKLEKEEKLLVSKLEKEEKLQALRSAKEESVFELNVRVEKLLDSQRLNFEKFQNYIINKEEKNLNDEVKEAKDILDTSEKHLSDYVKKNEILMNPNIKSQIDRANSRIGLFEKKLVAVQMELFQKGLEKPKHLNSLEQALKAAILKEQEQVTSLDKVFLRIGFLKDQVEKNRKSYELKQEHLKEIRLKNEKLREEASFKAAQLQEEKRLKFEQLVQERKLNSEPLQENVSLKIQQLREEGTLKLEQLREDFLNDKIFSVKAAQIPTVPFQPNWQKNLILSLLFALFFSIGLPLVIAIFEQRTFRTAEQIADSLKLPFLGVFSESAKDCCEIQTNLLFVSPQNLFKNLLVTSTTEKEKNASLSVALAIEMAKTEGRVLLVDCDFRTPQIHQKFQVSNSIGLSSLIIGKAELCDVIVQSSIPNLDLLVSGPMPPRYASLFNLPRFLDILEELKKRYDKVIFNASSIDSGMGSLTLGTQTDGTLLVIKAGVAQREAVEETVKILTESQIRLFGVVLDEMTPGRSWYAALLGKYYRQAYSYDSYGENPSA